MKLVGLTLYLVAAAITNTASVSADFANMNGDIYQLAPTPKGKDAIDGNWSMQFKDYPGGVEYWESYAGPITTTYSEVFWTGLPAVPLPDDIVKRFDNKVMAVVGFEADQVIKGKSGTGADDISVPITVAYNHHYGSNVIGKGSRMERVAIEERPDHITMHPGPDPGFGYIPVEHTPSLSGAPTSLQFGYSNGGEFRGSYHALVPPFAQLIESPQSLHVYPMQIDTWNRDKMNLTGSKFVPGPAPEKSGAPTSGPDAVYSGLLECPLTTRIRKQIVGGGWNDTMSVQLNACSAGVDMIKVNTSESCFAAAGEIGLGAPGAVITATGASNVLPAGCSVQRNISSSGPARLFWNTNAASTVGCGGAAVSAVAGSLDRESNGGLVGLELAVDGAAQVVNITMSGPANVWFGVGFNTLFMDNAPYAITVDGTTGVVTERVLGHHTAGIILNVSVTVVHTAVSDNVRTIMLQRATKGLTPHHHDFDPTQMSMDVIAAVGSAPAFGYHKAKTAATMPMWPARARIDPTAGGGNFALFGATQPPAQGTRNNYDGEVGFTFTAAHPLNVTALGRSGTALKAPTAVTLWDAKTRARLASVSVGPTSTTTTSDGYTYANLAAPVLLTSGTSYYITQTVTNGMPDAWVDTAANAASIEPWFGSAGAGVYSSTKGAAPDQTSTTGRWAGMVTLRATVAPHAVPGGGKDGAMPAACVCAVPAAPFGKGKGTIKYLPTGEVIGFPPRCNLGNADYSVMKNHNPTCDIRTYVGGLSTCHHGWHLLDADQELPWQDKPITYYLKFRLYYQPYTPPAATAAASDDDAAPPLPEKTLATTVAERVAAGQASHIGVFDITWSIAGDTGEYDVPQCAPGTPASECTHEIHGTIVPPGDDYHFVAAHYHCHAPTCIKLEIYNNRTGELLCSETPYHGAVDAASQKNRFDEPGYIAQRICLWGLQPPFEYPPLVSGETLFVRSITNSSYNHHGEMALPQMLLARLPK